MKPIYLSVFSTFLSMWSHCLADSVRVNGKDVELVFPADMAMISFPTNLVAHELSRYLDVGVGVDKLFCLQDATGGAPAPLDPVCPQVPPERIAQDIGIYVNPPERLLVGTNALFWLLTSIEESAPYSNTWAQAESLLASLATGDITNNMAHARESFVIGGEILTSSSRDAEIKAGVATYWTQLRYLPLSLMDWKMGKFSEEGPMIPGIRFNFIDVGMNPERISSEWLVFLDGRWRVAMFE